MNEKPFRPVICIVLAAANVFFFILCECTGGSENSATLLRWGADYTPLILDGQYWRLFASMFLHSGIRHLLNNMLLLFVIGMTVEKHLGRVRFVLLYLLGGLAGNVIANWFYVRTGRTVLSVGASGAVFAVIGAVIWMILRNRGRVEGLSLTQMLVMLGFSLYFGLTDRNVANAAHLGGLAGGFLLCIPPYRKAPPPNNWPPDGMGDNSTVNF